MALAFHSRELVLDTWPVMEWLKDTSGVASRLDELLERSEAGGIELAISRITVGEIFYVTARQYGLEYAEQLRELIKQWPVSIVEATESRVLSAARLKARHTISYADAFVAALAIERNAAVLTGDKDFLDLEQAEVVRVDWMGA